MKIYTFSRKQFYISTFYSYLTYFDTQMEVLIFNIFFFYSSEKETSYQKIT